MIVQHAPDPRELRKLVAGLEHRPGWQFTLHDSYVRWASALHDDDTSTDRRAYGMTLEVLIECVDTYHRDETRPARHLFAVPPETWDRASWQRWLFDRCCDVDRHEAMEFFMIDGVRPYEPGHPPSADPYSVR